MINKINAYSGRYEIELDNEVYDKIANHPDFREICGKPGDSFLVRGSGKGIFLIEKDNKTNKKIIKIHAEEPDSIQSQLENISGLNLSQYRRELKWQP